jgi:hypothetical protein
MLIRGTAVCTDIIEASAQAFLQAINQLSMRRQPDSDGARFYEMPPRNRGRPNPLAAPAGSELRSGQRRGGFLLAWHLWRVTRGTGTGVRRLPRLRCSKCRHSVRSTTDWPAGQARNASDSRHDRMARPVTPERLRLGPDETEFEKPRNLLGEFTPEKSDGKQESATTDLSEACSRQGPVTRFSIRAVSVLGF